MKKFRICVFIVFLIFLTSCINADGERTFHYGNKDDLNFGINLLEANDYNKFVILFDLENNNQVNDFSYTMEVICNITKPKEIIMTFPVINFNQTFKTDQYDFDYVVYNTNDHVVTNSIYSETLLSLNFEGPIGANHKFEYYDYLERDVIEKCLVKDFVLELATNKSQTYFINKYQIYYGELKLGDVDFLYKSSNAENINQEQEFLNLLKTSYFEYEIDK